MDPQTTEDKNKKLIEIKETANLGGGQKRIESQHAKGKFTARERISILLDENSFEETDSLVTHRSNEFGLDNQKFLGDAVVTGFGLINERLVFVYAQDFTVLGGSLSEAVSEKICKIMDLAIQNGAPIIGLIDSGGARIQEGIDSLSGYAKIFQRNVIASGVVPQISVMMGPAAGGATYSPALTDFIFMVEGTGQMYITGPDVIRAVTSEEISHEDLGGFHMHTQLSGVAHFSFQDEEITLQKVRELLEYIPQNNMEEAHVAETIEIEPSEMLNEIIPDNPNEPYDMLAIINEIIDDESLFQVQENFAKNIIVGFSRIAGQSIGIIAQQPEHLAGSLDVDASVKAARFVRFCDAFNIPLITFIDVPGFLPGVQQEKNGIIRHGAKLIYAYAEATVPKISILTRKAYGGSYIVMSSKNLNGDVNLAWPTGEIAVMGAEGAVNIIHKKDVTESESPSELKKELISDYENKFMNPYVAASRGLIDDVILPSDTRNKIIKSLQMLQNKRQNFPPKKHGTIPL
ncbi:MAG: acyl-CoA carboxylase subunit beta [SAR202 cluster bacterium]|nr:acyl-CoA carboxylase subunit beta [SAR202 cluster bacterium]